MDEAVEICKLRLFLKLAAQADTVDKLEPLPDIDFNIRAGNTLVGYHLPGGGAPGDDDHTRVDNTGRCFPRIKPSSTASRRRHEIASAAFNQFRWQQTIFGGADNRRRQGRTCAGVWTSLNATNSTGISPLSTESISETTLTPTRLGSASHQPFHWFVEFYGIMTKGGFDVVIGNPPYVEYRTVREEYQPTQLSGFHTRECRKSLRDVFMGAFSLPSGNVNGLPWS